MFCFPFSSVRICRLKHKNHYFPNIINSGLSNYNLEVRQILTCHKTIIYNLGCYYHGIGMPKELSITKINEWRIQLPVLLEIILPFYFLSLLLFVFTRENSVQIFFCISLLEIFLPELDCLSKLTSCLSGCTKKSSSIFDSFVKLTVSFSLLRLVLLYTFLFVLYVLKCWTFILHKRR